MSHGWNYGEDLSGKIRYIAHHPGEENDHGYHDGDYFRNKGEGCLIYGCYGLENADQKTDDQTESKKRRRQQQNSFEASSRQLYDHFGGHGSSFHASKASASLKG
jgi:hypothetical protein